MPAKREFYYLNLIKRKAFLLFVHLFFEASYFATGFCLSAIAANCAFIFCEKPEDFNKCNNYCCSQYAICDDFLNHISFFKRLNFPPDKQQVQLNKPTLWCKRPGMLPISSLRFLF